VSEPSHVALIVAMTRSGVIGKDGQLPWRLSADLRRFKTLTMGHALIMGRKTYSSLGRPLPGRTSIVITRQASLDLPAEVLVVHSLAEALHHVGHDDSPFVIGGGEVFALALPLAERLHVTWVEAEIDGDAYFPPWNLHEWRLVAEERHSADAKNQYDYTFAAYNRVTREFR
jgi:dihydrofolate reductase